MAVIDAPPRPTYDDRWFRQRRNQMLGVNWLTYLVNYLDRSKTTALMPLIAASLSLNTDQIGWVFFAFYIAFALAQPFAGFLTDWIGPRRTLAMSVTVFVIFTWTIAYVHTYHELLWRNALFGLFVCVEFTAAARLIAVWFPARTRGRAHAVHQTGNSLGAMLAPLVAAPLAEWTGSWRWVFIIIAFCGIPVIALLHRYVFDRPERSPRVSEQELVAIYGAEEAKRAGNTADPAHAGGAAELPPGERPVTMREAFVNRSVILLSLSTCLASLTVWGLVSWLPTYGVQELGLPLLASGVLSSVFWGGTILGVLAGGHLSDRVFKLKRTPVWMIGGIVTGLAIATAALLPAGVPTMALYVLFAVAGFFAVWSPLAILSPAYLAELLTPGVVGRVLGVTVFLGGLGSAFAQPIAAALVIHGPDGPHYWPVFLAFAGSALVSALCCFGMREPALGRTYLSQLFGGRSHT